MAHQSRMEFAKMTAQDSHRIVVIKKWMLSIISDGGVGRYDDLHIDQIDKNWGDRQKWLDAGLEAFRLAIDLRDQHQLDFTVSLAFSLQSGDKPRGLDFTNNQEFMDALDWSPPSLYLFRTGEEPWVLPYQPSSDLRLMSIDTLRMFGCKIDARRCYFMEFKNVGTNEYYRSIHVTG
jgi:hypothetical protein